MDNAVPTSTTLYALYVGSVYFRHVDRQIMGILGQPIKESLLITDTQLGLLTGIMFVVFYATPHAHGHGPIAGTVATSLLFRIFYGASDSSVRGCCNYIQLLLFRIGVGVGEAGLTRPLIP